MSFVTVTPELVEGAAQELAGIRSSLAEAAATATGPTTRIAAAAQDEISIAIASLFGGVGQEFQAMGAQAQAFHAEFVALMNAGAGSCGLLTPLSLPPLFLVSADISQQLMLSGGTGFGGLIPGLLSIESELAQAIALPAPVLPSFTF